MTADPHPRPWNDGSTTMHDGQVVPFPAPTPQGTRPQAMTAAAQPDFAQAAMSMPQPVMQPAYAAPMSPERSATAATDEGRPFERERLWLRHRLRMTAIFAVVLVAAAAATLALVWRYVPAASPRAAAANTGGFGGMGERPDAVGGTPGGGAALGAATRTAPGGRADRPRSMCDEEVADGPADPRHDWIMAASHGIDREIALAMAASQGVLHRDRLVALGLTPNAITKRVASGRLFRVAPQVYAPAPLATREGWWMAAVLTCAPDSYLSHDSASALYGGDRIARRRPVPGDGIHVMTPRRSVAAPFVIPHRPGGLVARDGTEHRGIPVTSIERMIVDLGSLRSEHQLVDLVHELTFRGNVHVAYVEELALRRRSGWHHAETVLGALALIESGVRGTRSELEDLFLRIVDEAGIRRPRTHVPIRIDGRDWEQDAVWEDVGLVVELDGRRSHGRLRNIVDDRTKDAALASIGRRVIRLRWIDLTRRSVDTVRRIRAVVGS